ncbi:MAG: manganese efflux pump MntP family protein [Bacillaceae bacterium]
MAFALGLDAFSVSIGMGITGLRLKNIFYIGIITGAFHVAMPLIGMGVGRFLSENFGGITHIIGGSILIVIGAHMVYQSFGEAEEKKFNPFGFGMIIFAFGVSIDSLTVGLSLGIFGARTIATVIIFGTVSTLLTWIGFLVGKRAGRLLGMYGEILGGCILFLFGIKLLWG